MLRSRGSKQSNTLWASDSIPDIATIATSDQEHPRRVRLRRTNTDIPHRPSNRKRLLTFVCLVIVLSLVLWSIHYLKPVPFSFVNTPTPELSSVLPGPKSRPHQQDVDHRTRPSRLSSSKQKQKQKPQNQHPAHTSQRSWPPLVTVVPETRPDPDKLYSGLTSSSVDAQFCNEAPRCQFLLPLWIGEQESRSRIHVVQILQLAMALNRTLILPNVGKSRLGACARWDFEVYYDVGSLVGKSQQQYDPGFSQETLPARTLPFRKAMLMDDFKTWLELRPEGPSSQLVFVDEKNSGEKIQALDQTRFLGRKLDGQGKRSYHTPLDVYVDDDTLDLQDSRLRKTKCLSSKFRQLDLDTFLPLSIHLPLDDAQKALVASDSLLQALVREDVRNHSFLGSRDMPSNSQDESPMKSLLTATPSPDVLILYWDIRHFPFASYSPRNLLYSAPLLKLSQRLTSPYKPYLAIHWRMETVPSSVLPDCAEALVDRLSSILDDPELGKGIKTIWFASDFPWGVSSFSEASSHTKDNPLDMNREDLLDFLGNKDQNVMNMKIDTSTRRSNTFTSITLEHIEAIQTFRNAFSNGGVLEGYKLTGVKEELSRIKREVGVEMEKDQERRRARYYDELVNENEEGKNDDEPEDKWGGRMFNILEEDDDGGILLQDPGVLGILDKLAAFNAALFVSGAKGCGRVR